MGYQTDLLEALRDWGLNVVEVNGWRTRGSSSFNPGGAVNHHTAGARNGVLPSLRILAEGRRDLPGPLCNVAQSRSTEYDPNLKYDDVFLVAAGRANHAGRGGWRGLVGNSSVFGLEIEHVGTNAEPFPERRLHTAYRIHRAFAEVGGYSFDKICQHKEWAPGRKIDFVNTVGDHFRHGVSLQTKAGGTNSSAPPPPAPPPPNPGQKTVWREGDRGEKVKEIQALCNKAGCSVGTADGVWGRKTTAGVKCLQVKLKVTADGVWGPKTQEAVERAIAYAKAQERARSRPASRPTIKRGDKGDHVKYLQGRLNKLGYSLRVDGNFGINTEQAVKRFQKGRGLAADGIVGPKTWSKLG